MNKFKTLRVKLFLILMTAWSSVVFAQPVITSFSPTTGAIGTTVTITGTGFNTAAAQNIVYFGGAKAVITSATATLLTVTVPVGSTYEPISATSALSGLTAFSSNPFDVTFNSVGGIDANSFDPRVNFTVGIQPYGIVSADLDLDGKPDLAIPNTNAANKVSVLRNNAAIGLINSSTLNSNITFSSGNITCSVQVADIDGDGRKDIIETNYGDNTFSVLMNTANPGSITSSSFAARVSFTTGSNPFGIAVNDIDMDGRPDVIVVNCQSNNISVFRNTSTLGNISFAPKVDFGISGQSFYVMLRDIDGDRKPEIIAVVTSTGGVTIFRNTSTPGIINASTFASALLIPTGLTPRDFDIADMDGDGKVDILVPNQDNANFSAYRNLSTVGSISFSARVNFSTVTNPSGAKIGDIDGDGKPDLVIIGSNTAQVFKNTSTSGTFSFGTGISFALGNSSMNTVIVDMDGDGKPEICVFDYNDGTISILHNKILTPPTITSFSPTSGSIGTLVSISGTALTNPAAFTIGGKAAIVISNDGSTLVGMVMPGATTGNISLTTGGGTVNSASNFTVIPSLLPVTQQGSKLVGTGNIGNAQQGYSVSISADGNTAIVGGWSDNGYIGAAWIYTRSGSIWTQQGSKLVGTGNIGNAQQGISVSLSADGNTVLVGGNGDNSNTGAAWIYTHSGSTWTQQGSKLVGTGAIGSANQGSSVSLSADGNTAIVGGQGDNASIGAAWIYTRSGSTWTQQGSKLVGSGNAGTSTQGSSVSLSADGNTALVGGYQDNNFIGAAWIYTRSGSTWTQQGSKLVGTGYIGSFICQGSSVSLSADGNTALVGGYGDNSVGAIWIYTRSGSTWTQQGSKLVGTVIQGNPQQGRSVSLSADGNTALVGGNSDNGGIGAVWIFTRSGSTWTQQGSKLVGTGYTGTPNQGRSVSLSADGNTALVGGYGDNTSIGAAWVFTPPPSPTVASFSPASGSVGTLVTISGTNLGTSSAFTIGGIAAIVISNTGTTLVGMVMPGATTGNISITTASGTVNSVSNFTVTPSLAPVSQQGSKLLGNDIAGTSSQGTSVSVSADGNTAIVGGSGDYYSIGAVWIYVRSGGIWSQQGGKLVGNDYVGNSYQGCSVALSADGNTALVGGYNDNSFVGAVWVYTRSGSTWTQQGTKLIGTGYSGLPRMGYSVSLSADGNTALFGGYADNASAGAVWVFTRNGSTWTQQGSKLVGTGNTGAPFLGASVSLSADGNTAIIGGYNDNTGMGAAWVFTRSGSVWSQQGTKLVGTGSTGTLVNQGYSVSLSADGNTALVGGDRENASGVITGAAWVYTRSGGVWSQQGSKLIGTGYVGNPYQGASVSLSADGNTALVSGHQDNFSKGAVWVYTRSGGVWTQYGNKLVGTGTAGVSGSTQGSSVSLSADGNTAIVGGSSDNNYIGAAWVFTPLLPPLAIDATGILANGFTANWNASTGATGYQLDVDDNNDFSSPIINNLDVTGFTTKAVTGLTPLTTYYYRVRAYNANSTSGNSNVITVITVSVITDIKDLQKENVIIVYPNPANGIITLSGLSFIANDQSVSLIISDIFGKTMLSKKLERNTISETIDISSLGNGVYFIILQTDIERIVKRFVKQ